MSVRVEQKDFDELLALLQRRYDRIDGTRSNAILMQALLEEFLASDEERVDFHRLITIMKTAKLRDPEHTPLPTTAPPLATRAKNSRPPPRSKPPPLPPRKR